MIRFALLSLLLLPLPACSNDGRDTLDPSTTSGPSSSTGDGNTGGSTTHEGSSSTSGGTDVCTGIIAATPLQPVYAGLMSGPVIGCDVAAFDIYGNPVVGELGDELFKGAVEELLYDLLPVLVVLSLLGDGVRPPLWFRLVVLKELSDEGIPHRGGSLAESLGFEATLRRIPRR